MRDIRELVPCMTPLMFKEKVRLLYVEDESYVAYSLFGKNFSHISSNSETYEIFSYILPASIQTDEKIGKSDFLIAWFDSQRDKRIDFTQYTECHIGIATKDISDEEIDFMEKFYEVDGYVYLKSVKPYNLTKYQDLIRNKTIIWDKVPLLKMSQINDKFYRREYKDGKVLIERLQPGKISIPHKIQPKSANDWSNIRYCMFELHRFGGNSVYPFAWLQRTTLVKKEI
jgi:hypothetical protein